MKARYLVSAALFAAAVVTQATAQDAVVADYRFNNSFSSSDSDPLSSANSVNPSHYTIFYQGALCLMQQWTGGGNLTMTVTPNAGITNEYSEVEFAIAGNTGGPVTVDEVTLKVNGVAVGSPRTIDAYPANDVFTWQLSMSSDQATTFELDFGGRGGGNSACEMSGWHVSCKRRPMMDPVTPISACTSACFDIMGSNFFHSTTAEIDGVDITQTGWTAQRNSRTSMTVCPPAGIAAGSYSLTLSNGSLSSTTALVVDDSTPSISGISNPTLPTVTGDCFLLSGCGFSNVTSVEFGSQTITSQNSADFGTGYFKIVDNHNLELCPPLCLTAGSFDVRVANSQGSSNHVPVSLTDPTTFTLACAPTHEIGQVQTIYLHAGGANGWMFPVISELFVPTVFPGLVSLDIGAQATSYLVGGPVSAPCGSSIVGMIPAKFLGRSLFFQAILLDFASSSLPLPVSNYCESQYVATTGIDIAPLGDGSVSQDSATGQGYLMFTAESVHTRFSSNWIWTETADHFVVVRNNGGQWEYDNNSVYTAFTPVAGDLLVAELDFTTEAVAMLDSRGAPINGLDAGYFASDLVITANTWAGSANNGEFWLQGTFLLK